MMATPKLLVICFPTWGKENELHLNSTGESVVLAPDEMIRVIENMGLAIDVVSLAAFTTDKPLMRSGKQLLRVEDISVEHYTRIWHMFRDPTQPEVLNLLKKSNLLESAHPAINDVRYLQNHHKWNYLPVLEKAGIGPEIIEIKPNTASKASWSPSMYNAKVATIEGQQVICTAAYNNNRGDYPERHGSENIYLKFLDNSGSGVRSFFRCGYSFGKVTAGWLYCGGADMLTQKSGSCKHQVPFQIPGRYHQVIIECMSELGIDVCHLEGMFIREKMYLFDINPYPTAHGNTLTFITEEICSAAIDAIHG